MDSQVLRHRPALVSLAAWASALVLGLAWTSAQVAAARTTTNATSVATDQTFSGFTLGAAVVAVLVGGAYWYFKR